MSSNTSSNSSNSTGYSAEDYRTVITALVASDLISLFLAIGINTWLLGCILTSRSLRITLRNQLLCSVSMLHLLENLFLVSFHIYQWFAFLYRWRIFTVCAAYDYLYTMIMICSAVPDLLIVLLAFVFLAQVLDFDPASRLNSRYLQIGHIAILAFPWLFAVTASPLALLGIAHRGYPCMIADHKRFYIVESVFTVFPLCVAAVVIGVAVISRCARFGRGNLTAQGNMGVQLMGSGKQIDSSVAYIAAIIVCTASEIFILIVYFSVNGTRTGYVYNVASMCIESYRAVFLPLTFLFLTDIRERVKVWRPWRRDTVPSGIDLTVAYNREQ